MPITGQYSNNTIIADGIIVYNTSNNGFVVIKTGTLETDVPPFTRDVVLLGGKSQLDVLINFTVGAINLLFYKGKPPVTPTLLNYAGAAALSNTVAFPGGTTSGTPTNQQITVASNYAFSNGNIIMGTWGFDTPGPTNLNVNGLGSIPITKIIRGDIHAALDVGDGLAGTSFLLVVNTTSGTFDLMDVAGRIPVAVRGNNPTTGTPNNQTLIVGSDYVTANGVLINGTSGFTNTGPTNLTVSNGTDLTGPFPVTYRGAALVGGELVAGENFLVSENTAANTFELIGPTAIERFTSAPFTVPATNTAVNTAHGLGAMPFDWISYVVCNIADQGWVPGQVVKLDQPSQQNAGLALSADAVNVTVYMSSGGVFLPMPASTGDTFAIDPTKWSMIVKAWL